MSLVNSPYSASANLGGRVVIDSYREYYGVVGSNKLKVGGARMEFHFDSESDLKGANWIQMVKEDGGKAFYDGTSYPGYYALPKW